MAPRFIIMGGVIMSKNKDSVKVKEQNVQIQYEPYEKYITRNISNIHNRLEKIERAQQVIKERITFDYPDKNGKK